MILESYIKRGSSSPVVINDNGKKYFVKLHAGMNGKYALINEWIGNKLGNLLQLNTQTPIWIDINDSLSTTTVYIEIRELINKSLGLNIGFEFKENVNDLIEKELSTVNKKELVEIFLLDLVMINIDRSNSNLNLIKVNENIISIDYESSLLLQEIIENRNILNNRRILECLRSNPLYQEIDSQIIHEFIKKLNNISIDRIIKDIPEKLLNNEQRKLIIDNIQERKRMGWFLKETIHQLKNIKIESQETRKNKIKNNQAKLIKNMKKNRIG